MTQKEYDDIAAWMMNNYIQHTNALKRLSSDDLPEIQLKAAIRNDNETQFIAELASNLSD